MYHRAPNDRVVEFSKGDGCCLGGKHEVVGAYF